MMLKFFWHGRGGGSIVVPDRKYPGPSVCALFCCGKLGATEFFGRIQKLVSGFGQSCVALDLYYYVCAVRRQDDTFQNVVKYTTQNHAINSSGL